MAQGGVGDQCDHFRHGGSPLKEKQRRFGFEPQSLWELLGRTKRLR
jgi:hypothetical protein